LTWIALTRTSAFDGEKGCGEGRFSDPEFLGLDDAGVAAEAAPTKNGLLWGDFCPEHPFSMRQGVTVKAAPATLSLWLSMAQKVAAKAAPTKNGLLWGGL